MTKDELNKIRRRADAATPGAARPPRVNADRVGWPKWAATEAMLVTTLFRNKLHRIDPTNAREK